MIAENTAKVATDYGGGKYSTATLYDLKHTGPAEMKTGQEIVDDITQRMGLEVINDGII